MKRILVTGGAGFIGSHLCVRLLNEGCQVVCLDVEIYPVHHRAQFVIGCGKQATEQDITPPYCPDGPIDEIYNLACPASPIHYQYNPIKTLKTNVLGAINMLDLAIKKRSKLLQASTSEVYGDPAVHPFFPCPGQSRSQGRNGAGADLHCAARRYMTRPLYRRALVGRLACKAGPGAGRGKTVPPQGGGDNNAFCAGSEETL